MTCLSKQISNDKIQWDLELISPHLPLHTTLPPDIIPPIPTAQGSEKTMHPAICKRTPAPANRLLGKQSRTPAICHWNYQLLRVRQTHPRQQLPLLLDFITLSSASTHCSTYGLIFIDAVFYCSASAERVFNSPLFRARSSSL